jgi:hypothetical protein
MQRFSPARLRAGITGFSVLVLFVLTAGASTSFAAEHASSVRQSSAQSQVLVDFDHSTISREQPGIIMRDGGVCDPIRHMGC